MNRYETLSDEQIVRRIQAGERGLFDILYRRHSQRLCNFGRRLGLQGADLEDLLTDTFTRALNGIHAFQVAPNARYLPYLYAILRNLARDRARARARQPEALPLDEISSIPAAPEPPPLEQLLFAEQISEIRSAMQRLNESDRTIIMLSYERELSSKEIMQVMAKPSVTAVTTHLYKAMVKLRQQILRQESRREREEQERL